MTKVQRELDHSTHSDETTCATSSSVTLASIVSSGVGGALDSPLPLPSSLGIASLGGGGANRLGSSVGLGVSLAMAGGVSEVDSSGEEGEQGSDATGEGLHTIPCCDVILPSAHSSAAYAN